jgi:hypothetical protein
LLGLARRWSVMVAREIVIESPAVGFTDANFVRDGLDRLDGRVIPAAVTLRGGRSQESRGIVLCEVNDRGFGLVGGRPQSLIASLITYRWYSPIATSKSKMWALRGPTSFSSRIK